MSLAIEAKPILIIGGGLAGLALAQGCKRAGVPFRAFERDMASMFRAQGYRIRVMGDSLQRLLPPNLFQEFENSCGNVVHGGNLVDAMTGKRAEWPGDAPAGPKGALNGMKAWNADRGVLRAVLMKGLVEGQEISFGKKLVRYELLDDGVAAHFADGSVEHGRMIVGADGGKSVVRKQLVPEQIVLDTEGRAIFGKTSIKDGLLDNVPQEIGQGLCVIADSSDKEHPMKLFCDTMIFQGRDRASVTLPPDYIYWVLSFQKERQKMTDSEFMQLSHEGSVAKSLEMTANWADNVKTILRHQDSESTSALAFLTASPNLIAWKSDPRITLLGDAAHVMVPIGGQGANTAFADAADLVDIVRDGIKSQELERHEAKMREISSAAILRGLKGAVSFFGMKPLEDLKPQQLW